MESAATGRDGGDSDGGRGGKASGFFSKAGLKMLMPEVTPTTVTTIAVNMLNPRPLIS